MTGLDLAEQILRTLGALSQGETASNADAEAVRTRVNAMIDSWQIERLMMYFLTRTTQTLSSGTASYTIGSGGTIDIARPFTIEKAGLIIDTAASTPTELTYPRFRIFRDEEYEAIAQKTLQSSLSQGIWFDHNWSSGLARIYPWPIPNVGTTQLVLYTPTAISEFADLTTEYSLAPGYERALLWNGAKECATEFAKPVSGEIAANAADSKGWVKRANRRTRTLRVDPALVGVGGAYNIRTDGPSYR